MTEWQTMETAPKDTDVLLYLGDGYMVIGEGWHTYDEPPYGEPSKELYWWVLETGQVHPTHWMPLPEPPILKEGE
jgi:hypothetical protein